MSLVLKNVSKSFPLIYGSVKTIFHSINLNINKNEFSSILAPYGSGKTTLLKIISAVENVDSGEVLLNDKKYSEPSSNIVFIPSEPVSFPWLSVLDNIKFVNPSADFNNLIKLVGLENYEDYFPQNESIGFRFRISLARALSVNPEFILLDEPFNKLDNVTKFEIYNLLIELKEKTNISFVLTTTNINESLILSDNILIMKNSGNIFENFPVSLKGNSTKDLLLNQNYIKLKNDLIEKIKSENIYDTINYSI